MDRSRAEPSRAAAKTSAGSQNTRDGCSSPYERGVSVWLPRRKHDLPPPRAPSFMPERTLPVCVFLSPDVKHCCLLEPTTAKLCERHTHMRTHNHTLTHTHTPPLQQQQRRRRGQPAICHVARVSPLSRPGNDEDTHEDANNRALLLLIIPVGWQAAPCWLLPENTGQLSLSHW